MAATKDRWLGGKTLAIGGVTVDDLIGGTIQSGGQIIASTSEAKKFANYFVDMVQKGDAITLQTYDVAACQSLRSTRIGKGTSFTMKINPSTEGSGASIVASATSPLAVITEITIPF